MSEILSLLTNGILSLIEYVIILRAMLVFAQFTWHHPIVQALDRVSGPLMTPLRRHIPNVKNIECASLVVICVIEALRIVLISLLSLGHILSPVDLLVFTLSGALRHILKAYFFAVLVYWITPTGPASVVLTAIVEPILRPVRKYIPPIGGLDLTPTLVLFGILLLLMPLP